MNVGGATFNVDVVVDVDFDVYVDAYVYKGWASKQSKASKALLLAGFVFTLMNKQPAGEQEKALLFIFFLSYLLME